MTAEDPIKFSFGLNFLPAPERMRGEAEERKALVARELGYHDAFLDDVLRGILPHDLILLCAETGAGKTDRAVGIARANVQRGKRVHYFALEAEDKEIERRAKYTALAELAFQANVVGVDRLNYPDWYRGKCDDVIARFEYDAERMVGLQLRTLHTYYRGSSFGHDDIKRLFLAIKDETDLIILDHLHYVDIEDENENRGFKKTVKMIRDVSLGIGVPILVVAHLRKRDMRSRSIVPDIEMVHGSSDVIKICTQVIMMAPARSLPAKTSYIANTFVHVPKDRMGGASGYVALCHYDRRFRTYAPHYTLGRQSFAGDTFEELSANELPRWAKRHRANGGGL